MLKTNRPYDIEAAGQRCAGGAALAALPLPAAAQRRSLHLVRLPELQGGTIHSLDPKTRGFVIIWEDLGRVKLKAADLVTNYAQLKVGQIVDVQWYDYVDFLIAKKTPETIGAGQGDDGQGARIEGLPGSQERIRLWENGRHVHEGRSRDQHGLSDQCLRW